ncbi:MAG: NADH-quinone oxidoreductase subunit NuoF [Nitrospirae bacterium]|nr:NADH-quinone oxidoreductase subunit NuoF [Nitrospirota bacterium]MBF0534003.1 NADH-quinone oxidoreductase subunit NuoF [Nitrospirota bacterium]MBF0616162.1 NADH-quinone oxidoreductase subunit NuoF [Nitrospirota bacterium]
MDERIILRNTEDPHNASIAGYMAYGGYKALEQAVGEMTPRDIIDEIKSSGLRGRGGAGFPTGMKWQFASLDPKFPKYLVCNADEGEPGTFKDRPILEHNPHLLIEGMIISAYALQSTRGYIYLRGEYPHAKRILERAIEEALASGYLGNDILSKHFRFNLTVHSGAGAYICGEETALLDSLEGRRGLPRLKPPFPVNSGLWGKPTIVNNVETFANIPYIVSQGAKAYASIGVKDCPGPKLFSVSGRVNKPGVYELPMGISLREIIYTHCGGIKGGGALKGVIPGGISTPIIAPENIDCPMDFVHLPKYGSMLGSGAVMVFDDTVCIVRVYERAMKFFEHESCGKCTPCREGTAWMRAILGRIERGDASERDLETLQDVAENVTGKTFCPLGDGAAGVLLAAMKTYREEFEYHIKNKRCKVQ